MKEQDLVLISRKLCPYVQRARIVLAEKSVPHQVRFIDLGNKPDWFLEISPLGKVPVLLAGGQSVFESAVIAEYVDEISPGSLHPREPLARALNRSWIEFASKTLDAIGDFYSAADAPAFERATDTLHARFARLESTLGDGPFFNGRRFSLVDAAFGPVFRYFDVIDRHEDFGFFSGRPKLAAWRKALGQRRSVQTAVVPDYPERLERFFIERNSILGRRLASGIGAALNCG